MKYRLVSRVGEFSATTVPNLVTGLKAWPENFTHLVTFWRAFIYYYLLLFLGEWRAAISLGLASFVPRFQTWQVKYRIVGCSKVQNSGQFS